MAELRLQTATSGLIARETYELNNVNENINKDERHGESWPNCVYKLLHPA